MSENKEDRIRESIDSIEPAHGAKERMLANIRRKAAEQMAEAEQVAPPKKSNATLFNRITKLVLPIAACFVIVVVGITIIPGLFDNSNPIQQGGGFMSIENAEVFESTLGITIDAPEDAEEIAYALIDSQIADICFIYDGHDYNLRASKQTGDFSGVGGIEIETKQIDSQTSAFLSVLQNENDLYRTITWADGKTIYILSNTDGASDNEIQAVFEKIK